MIGANKYFLVTPDGACNRSMKEQAMRSFCRLCRSPAAAAVLLALSGCDDAPVAPETAAPPTGELAARGGAPSNDWLTIDDVRSPAFWLIERSSGRDFVGDDPRVKVVESALDEAQAVFHENRRMLANRTAQLADVSGEEGEPILPETLLEDLSYPDKKGGKAWFGVRAQAYIVLRQTGSSHAQAIATMKEADGQP